MVEVKKINPSGQPAWDSYVQGHAGCGVYLSSAWQEAVEKGYGHPTFYLAAYQGQSIVGVLPLALIKMPWRRGNLVSLPFCDYGGLLADSTEVASTLLGQALQLADELQAGLEIRMRQPAPVVERAGRFSQVSGKCRMVLNLPGDASQLWAGFKSKLRSQINRARKAGLVGRMGHADLLSDFYQVFTQNMRDLGSPVHSEKWLRSIVAAYGNRAKVGVVYQDSFPVAAGITLAHGNSMTIPWASAVREFNKLSPNMLLYWTFLEDAADSRFTSFDFGRSTPDEGTYAFKKQWGAQPVPLYWYRKGEHVLAKQKEKRGGCRMVVEKIWKYLPLPVANYCGPHLRKYIDR
ncbi:MAG: FemAB family XrtA/PEP-CTERM system-associated protein [Thermodesulfobacteriota bacterium]